MKIRPLTISVVRVASALLIAEMLVFALCIVPEHITASNSHDNCEICALIHHPPIVQADATVISGPLLHRDFLPLPEILSPVQEPQVDIELSRAPPSLV